MSRPRIALLNAAHEGENTSRNFQRELDADVVEFDVTGGHLPETFDFDGVVISGSRSSVYWDEAWIEPTREWVREADDRGLPILGVCFGHQLVADALGGTVEDSGDTELGYREIERVTDGDDPVLGNLDETFVAFETHSDEVTELPPGADLTAENDYSVQGFRREHAFGVQFHPEFDTETARTVAEGKDLPDERIERVLDGINEKNYAAACETKRLFDDFVAYAEELRADVVADD